MKTVEYRRVPLAHNHSTYMGVNDPAEMLALNKRRDKIVFNEKAQRMGLNEDDYMILCVYEVDGETKRIHYQYDLWGGVKHLSEQLKAALPSVLKEEFV
jgi:hypothetical protein